MTSLTNAIFVNENENIFEVFNTEGVEYNTQIVKNLQFISNKTSNNMIGYYQFKSNEIYYKVYILPKTSPKVEDATENKKHFMELLREYYRLKRKYDVVQTSLNKNIIDFSFNDEKCETKSDNVEDFIAYKYDEALHIIKEFFKKHNKSLYKELHFNSQNIKHRLDLKRNIVELDKSKIHQTRKIPYVYSKFAVISSKVLHYFIKYKTKDMQSKRTISASKKLKSKIDVKYLQNSMYEFKIKDIFSKKVTKLFKNSDENALYLALLQLLGAENYFEDQSNKEIFKLHNQHSLFFSPEKLFEWAVYDMLLCNRKLAVEKEPKRSYTIDSINSQNNPHRVAKPDFVVRYKNEVIVIDAKWKILDSAGEILFDDIAKLRRDGLIIGNVTKSILIYPKIKFKDKDRKFKLSVDDFNFEIDECKIVAEEKIKCT